MSGQTMRTSLMQRATMSRRSGDITGCSRWNSDTVSPSSPINSDEVVHDDRIRRAMRSAAGSKPSDRSFVTNSSKGWRLTFMFKRGKTPNETKLRDRRRERKFSSQQLNDSTSQFLFTPGGGSLQRLVRRLFSVEHKTGEEMRGRVAINLLR